MEKFDISDLGWMTDSQINGLTTMYKNKIEIETIKLGAYLQMRALTQAELMKITKLEYKINLVTYNILISKIRYFQTNKTKSWHEKIM